MPDLLRTEASERVDLGDWQYATTSALDAMGRHTVEQVLTNPTGANRTWILEGFRMTNPAAQQIQVTRGVAMLAYREAGQTRFGAVAAEGDVNKIVDIASFANNTYGIFIRFEYIDGDQQNRVFWNPSGLGSEFARSIPTRIKANWSVRIELSSPGGEWMQIGTVLKSGGPPAITDQRKLYFEGAVNAAYQSGWSTDGGGVANDRNADRQQFGVRDFQTFTAAMRQCLEDVKGRGLRRWWDPDIGGMNVGFNAAPVEDRIALGDANYNFLHTSPGVSSNPQLTFDGSNDRLVYSRSGNTYDFQIAGTTEMILGTTGLRVTDGLVVGHAGTPVNDEIQVGDTEFRVDFVSTTDVRLNCALNDYLQYNRTTDNFNFVINSVTEAVIGASGLIITNGLVVGHAGTPVDDNVTIGDASFGLIYGGNPDLLFDSGDRLTYNRGGNWFEWAIGSAVEMYLDTAQLYPGVNQGLNLGHPSFRWGATYIGVLDTTGGSLGGTAGNTLGILQFHHHNGNNTYTHGYAHRYANGGDWTTASVYYHHLVDATYMGFLRYSGDSVDLFNAYNTRHVALGVGTVGAAGNLLVTSDGAFVNGTTFGIHNPAANANRDMWLFHLETATSDLILGWDLGDPVIGVAGTGGIILRIHPQSSPSTHRNIVTWGDGVEDFIFNIVGAGSTDVNFTNIDTFTITSNDTSGGVDGVFQSTGAAFFLDNQNTGGEMFLLRAGPDDPSASTVEYIGCQDGNATAVGSIRNVNGTFTFLDQSDPRVKQDIIPTKVVGLDIIRGLELIEFRFKSKAGDESGAIHRIGFNADNCEQVFPDMVHVVNNGIKNQGKSKSIETKKMTDRQALIPVLVKAMQELLGEVDSLKQQIAALA